MRKFTTRIYTKANYLLNRGRMALSNQRGDFYISDAVKIIIAVVLGALLLAALTLIQDHFLHHIPDFLLMQAKLRYRYLLIEQLQR